MLFSYRLLFLMPNIYLVILFILLFYVSVIITRQVLQIFLLQYNYWRLCKLQLRAKLSIDQVFLLVQVLIEKKLWLYALKELESLDKINLEYKHKYFNAFGFIYDKMHKYNLAKIYYCKALALKKDYCVALYNLARVYEIQKNYNLALITYQSVILYKPDDLNIIRKIDEIKNRDSRI